MLLSFNYTRIDSDHDELYHLTFLNITGIRQNLFGLHNTVICPNIHPVDKPGTNGCPLKAGVEYLYHLDYEISSKLPKVSN